MPVFNPILVNVQPASAEPSTLAGPLDPVEVYKNTRPADWLPMPEPAENEMYLLVHIPDGVSALLAFTTTVPREYFSGPNGLQGYEGGFSEIQLGTVMDGEFSPIQDPIRIETGQKYETELFADNYGNLTSDGMKQVMIKITSVFSGNILTWEPSTHSKKTSPSDFKNWNIVEISCNLPNATSVKCGNNSTSAALTNLRYFSMTGTNQITNMSNMFKYCNSLTSIPQLDTSQVTNMSYMFYGCSSLTSIPQLDTSSVTTMSCMFNSCFSLTSIPQLDTSQVTNMRNMFQNCYSLTSIPQLDTSQVTNMSYMFQNCFSLTSIPQLDTSQVTNMSYMFYGCSSLTSIPQLDTSSVITMSCMFDTCYSLTSIPQLDTSSVISMSSMFSYCPSLTSIPQLDTSSVTNMSDMFNRCYSLAFVVFQAADGWAGYDISLQDCSLGKAALETLINNLPTLAASKNLTLTGNPGVSELTDEIKAVAASKNWTLVL